MRNMSVCDSLLRSFMERYALLALDFSGVDDDEMLSPIIKGANASEKQIILLRQYMAILRDSASIASSSWIRYLISVFSFILRYPDGTKENCIRARSFALHLRKENGELLLLVFYEELREAGYPESEINEILALSEGISGNSGDSA